MLDMTKLKSVFEELKKEREKLEANLNELIAFRQDVAKIVTSDSLEDDKKIAQIVDRIARDHPLVDFTGGNS